MLERFKKWIEKLLSEYEPKCKCRSTIVSDVFKIKKPNKQSKSKQRRKK